MNTVDTHFFDPLTLEEAHAAEASMRDLGGVAWAQPLLADIAENGGLIHANKDRFFELRFGHELHRAGIVPAYEVPGEGQSTIDFGFSHRGRQWRVELMRLTESQAMRNATHVSQDASGTVWASQLLGSSVGDPKETEGGETLKAVERICQKCERAGKPHKFPLPGDVLQILLVDFRTFLVGRSDGADRIHVGLGAQYVRDPMLRQSYEGKPISGVFDPATRMHGASEIQERVHFLGFVQEKTFRPGDLARATQFIANPHLFVDADEVHAAIGAWPLQPAHVINGR